MSITVREAVPADFDEIRRITRDAYVLDGHIDPDHGYLAKLQDVEDRAANAAGLWVAELDGKVVGSTALTFTGQPYTDIAVEGELEFRMLAVDPAVRRRGVGRAIVAAVIDYARTLDGIEAVSLTSMSSMTGAHALYLAMGFERQPERDWTVPGMDLPLLVFRRRL